MLASECCKQVLLGREWWAAHGIPKGAENEKIFVHFNGWDLMHSILLPNTKR